MAPIALTVAITSGIPVHAQNLDRPTLDQLRDMSIADLAQVRVTSASKTPQPLADAAASIYVLKREEIVRSGAMTLPEMLRLAPNLQVYETHPGTWVVTARGMNGNQGAQSFSNKLLVLVDGRTVYTPLFSGVYWDLPDVLPNDIDRIEIISGPGATLWGANAVNGVINIITRDASQSTGAYAGVQGGAGMRAAGLRHGALIGDTLAFKVHGRWLEQDSFRSAAGDPAGNGRDRLGGGFQLEWTPATADTITLAGEAFRGNLDTAPGAFEATSGRNLTLRWNRVASARSQLQLQLFYDRITRATEPDGGRFAVDTWDAELQSTRLVGRRNTLVWGAGARVASYRIDGTPGFFFAPDHRRLILANAFAQDSFAVTPRLTLVAGIKLEKDPYAAATLLPEFRIAWKPQPTTLVWGAVSRAVRSPTPFDVDVQERAGIISLSGNPRFRTEKLTSAEIGLRMQPAGTISFSINGFYNIYDDLRTVELIRGPGLALAWDNGLQGHSQGIDGWADWQPTRWWTLSAGASWLSQDFHFAPGASGILGTSQLGTDPAYQVKLRSAMNLGRHIRLDANFRAVGALAGSGVGAYRELGGRLAWLAGPAVFSISASNLLHDQHQEYPGGDFIPRRIMVGLELRH